jgi:hypothetical protein
MDSSDSLTFTLELARANKAGRPYDCVFAPQAYVLRSADGGFKDATFPWTEALLADLAQLRRPDRDPVVVQRLGELMRTFLAPTNWPVIEAEVLAAVEQGHPVVIAIRSAAAEIYALPWELLTIEATGQHLGELPGVLMRYEWPETRTAPSRTSQRAGEERLLFAWSGHVPASDHQRAIAEACAGRARSFDVDHDVLPHACCSRLAETLRSATAEDRPITILHLLCHGVATGSTFGLALDEDEPGDGVGAVDPGRLRQILAPHAATLRLVVLAACDSANAGAIGNPMGSVAQTLHRAGIAAVIASRFPLSTSGAHRLTRELYASLVGRTSSLEHAYRAARTCLAEDARQLDWASLQLYSRGSREPSSTRGGEVHAISAVPVAALRSPEVREELSRFRALFSTTPGQISMLGGYKELHDVLQDLEAPFNAIVRDHKRLLADPEAWEDLRDPIESLQLLVENTLAIMASDLLRDEFEASSRRLAAAKAMIEAAVAGDTRKLEPAIFHIQRALRLDLSSANTRLVTTARGLRLGDVVAALRSVVNNLERRGVVTAVDVLGRLVASADTLHAALDALVHEHDRWQAIANDLNHLVDTGRFSLDEMQLSWPIVLGNLNALLSPSSEWSRPIDLAARELDAVLAPCGDARRWITCLRTLVRRSNQRFIAVDKQLLRTCEALRGVGDTLDSVLQVIDAR